MITSTRLALPIAEGTDAPDVYPANVNAPAMDILDNAAIWTSGVLASRPVATTVIAGTYYYATDTGQLYMGTGSVWLVAPVASLTYTSLSLASGVTAFTGDYTPSARVEGDRVWLRGTVENTSGGNITANTTIFTLPSGMGPSVATAIVPAMNSFSATSTTAVCLQVSSSRTVSLSINIATGSTVPLNGLNFSLI